MEKYRPLVLFQTKFFTPVFGATVEIKPLFYLQGNKLGYSNEQLIYY